MAAARANWHLDHVETPLSEDPFDVPVEEVGERIDLTDASERLHARLRILCQREARIAELGITCAIKERPDTACSACPVCQANNPESPISLLCRTGREQEAVCTELAARHNTVESCRRP